MKSNAEMELSQRVLSVAPSATLAITAKTKELKAQGVDVISLSAGEPDFDTPEFVKEAAVTALGKGVTRYTPASGTLELRQAVSDKIKRDQKLEYPADQIIISCGAKHSIFNVLFALLNQNDEVAIPTPYWLSYPEMVTLLGGQSTFLRTDEATHFKITPEILRKGLTPKTKVLILNSPSNPTGAVYTKEELLALVPVLKEFPKLTIISDEIYEKLIFDGGTHTSIAELDDDVRARTVIVNGHSKAYAMTGWRLGYTVCPNKALAKAIGSLQSHSTSNPTAFAQAGGVVALERGDAEAKKMLTVFEKRRNLFIEKLKTVPQLKPFKPQGAFYLFVNIADSGKDSVALAKALLEEAHVGVVPGLPFGSDQHIRMSFATSDEHLIEAAKRIADWFKK